MSRAPWRNFRFAPFWPLSSRLNNSLAPWSSLVSGCVDIPVSSPVSISSMSTPLEDSSDSLPPVPLAFFRRLAFDAVLAQLGVGCRSWYCRRSRRMYSLPLTRSSASVTRNFLNLSWLASETVSRSSSLSCQTGSIGWPNSFSSSSLSEAVSGRGTRAPEFSTPPESR